MAKIYSLAESIAIGRFGENFTPAQLAAVEAEARAMGLDPATGQPARAATTPCPICGTPLAADEYVPHTELHAVANQPPATNIPPYEPGPYWGTTGGTNMATNPWAVGSPQFMEETYGRWPGFGTALGLYGRQYLSPYEQYMAGQQPSLEALYDIGGRMGTAGGFPQYAPGGMFSQWAPQYAQNPFAMYALARSMMGSAAGMTPEQRAVAEIPAGGADLSSLLQMALRTQLGKGTAGWIAGKMPAEQQAWTAQYPQQQGPSFLDYVMQKYGLSRFF